ncbi:Aldehyde dehydrogenase family 3 member B1 [Halotydeus destructor]|nr:Aldehyde dehydrogenase family 3 member B1 [Halotydeus destructor]
MEHVSEVVNMARAAFRSHRTKDVPFRRQQLEQLMKLIDDNDQSILAALRADFSKPEFEGIAYELDYIRSSVKTALRCLDQWVKPAMVAKDLLTMFDTPVIMHEPFGTVLIIAPWNLPIQLFFGPLVGTIAAGNCAILKPSELIPNTSAIFAQLIPEYLDKECYHVITGGPEATQALLREKFDYIFFTGSTQVGRLVYEAAAKQLIPVTLELGGKSPVIIDDSVTNLQMTTRRLLWGKWVNAGQTCIAPDYVLCSANVQQKLIQHASAILKSFGDTDSKNDDYAAIVTENHYNRLESLLKRTQGSIAVGGQCDAGRRSIVTTVVTNVQREDSLMREEMFGPILSIMTVESIDEAINYINDNDKPLALYLFSNDDKVTNKVLRETSSGMVCVNDVMLQFSVAEFPFGGVGASGIGKYHGKYSFETFSNKKPVRIRGFDQVLEKVGGFRYPPYTKAKMDAFRAAVFPFRNPITLTGNMISAVTAAGYEKVCSMFA